MPFPIPTLKQERKNARAFLMAALEGADALIANSNTRVMADVNAGLSHLNLQFIEWLSGQLLPIKSEDEWLDRWATMYLINSDGSRGRKQASYASGTGQVLVTGTQGAMVAEGTILGSGSGVDYQVTETSTASSAGQFLTMPLVALTPGAIGNLDAGATIGFTSPPAGVEFGGTIVQMTGGADTETNDQLRYRLLLRLANVPMGGDATDYVQWALAVPGVTRAWASPQEMGIGTMTVRFMCDSLRAANQGFPTPTDIVAVTNYINTVRPVTVKDLFVEAPIPYFIDFTVSNLVTDDTTTWDGITTSVTSMLLDKAAPAYAVNGIAQPAQTIYSAWLNDAIYQVAGVDHFDLYDANGNPAVDYVMPNAGSLAVMGNVIHG